jgi:hypothetical protein
LRKTAGTHICYYLTHAISIDERNFKVADYYVNGIRLIDAFQAHDVMCKQL